MHGPPASVKDGKEPLSSRSIFVYVRIFIQQNYHVTMAIVDNGRTIAVNKLFN